MPDIDVLAYFWGGEAALWFRRGWTHGIVAWIALPLALTGCVLLLKSLKGHGRTDGDRVSGRQILLLSTIAVATHPLLDFLNVYGIRLFFPFSTRWYYGDTLFIVDPWLWVILTAGLWLSRQSRKSPAIALAVAGTYVTVMAASNIVARRHVERGVRSEGGSVDRMMVAPIAVTPLERRVVVEDSLGYRVGMFEWLPTPGVELQRLPFAKVSSGYVTKAAAREPAAEKFLTWARFPYYLLLSRSELATLYIGDARYTTDPEEGWATTRLSVDTDLR